MLGQPTLCAAPPPGKVSRVGFVSPQSPSTAPRGVNAFWDRMRELGYVEGQNLVVESRWAEDRYDRLPDSRPRCYRKADVLVTVATARAIAAKNRRHDPHRRCRDRRPGAHGTGEQPGPAGGEPDRTVDRLRRRHGRQVARTAPRDGSAAVYAGGGGDPATRWCETSQRSSRPSCQREVEAAVNRGAGTEGPRSCFRAGGTQGSGSSRAARPDDSGAPRAG